MRIEFKSQRISWGHQHGRRTTVYMKRIINNKARSPFFFLVKTANVAA